MPTHPHACRTSVDREHLILQPLDEGRSLPQLAIEHGSVIARPACGWLDSVLTVSQLLRIDGVFAYPEAADRA